MLTSFCQLTSNNDDSIGRGEYASSDIDGLACVSPRVLHPSVSDGQVTPAINTGHMDSVPGGNVSPVQPPYNQGGGGADSLTDDRKISSDFNFYVWRRSNVNGWSS